MIQRYLGKIRGPLLDRIDIHLEVPAVPYKEMRASGVSESSAEVRAVGARTRAIQRARGFYNAQLPTRHIRSLCTLDDAGERTLEMAVRRMGLSARAHDRILKLGAPSPTWANPKQSPPSTSRRRCNMELGSQLLELHRLPGSLVRSSCVGNALPIQAHLYWTRLRLA
jgi:hypothetical protein